MSSVSPVGQLVSAIRSQLGATAAGKVRKRGRGHAGRAGETEGLQGLIELRVAQIAPDDPQRGRRAFRVFLEAVLLAHFGDKLVNDAAFHQMLDDMQQAMEADPACSKLVEKAVRYLLPHRP